MRAERNKKNRSGGKIVLIVLVVLLLIFEAGTLLLWQNAEKNLKISEAEPRKLTDAQLREEGWVPAQEVTSLADKFGVSTEFLSSLFPNKIIYKGNEGLVVEDVDANLAKAPQDWKNLKWTEGRPSYSSDDSTATLGIDISHHQGNIDWDAVKADGVQYAIIRAGYRGYSNGEMKQDTEFSSNMSGAAAAGLDLGVYYFSQAITVDEAIEEAEALISACSQYDIQMPVVFDMEDASGESSRTDSLSQAEATDIAIAFMDKVAEAGYTPMIYGNTKWLAGRFDPARLEGYEKWLAQYFTTPAYPYEFKMWQYTNTGEVAGISGEVDMNLYFE